MYKVFINEKSFSISQQPEIAEHNIAFNGKSSLQTALEWIEQPATASVNLYGDAIDRIWQEFQSLFTIVEAAGGVVANPNNELLFIYRLGKWDLPKGKLEKNEKIEDAAIREVEEETSIHRLELGDFLKETYHIYTEKKNKKILKKTYWFSMKHLGNEQPIPQQEEGISKVEWLPYKKVQESIYPKTFKNIQEVLNLYFKLNHLI
ncbi:NUDIX hydrolase [Riemerella columbina]|uniref:NUDIX hydrolase n=1 Tax=Riemerella columbina TaxID=103810 RepID=UPI0026702CA8|nr:NUDIX domain-containing protein [Riemerella columbina]WKS94318.1 NUDIX domain-containing protein [Riemerella columbina]